MWLRSGASGENTEPCEVCWSFLNYIRLLSKRHKLDRVVRPAAGFLQTRRLSVKRDKAF